MAMASNYFKIISSNAGSKIIPLTGEFVIHMSLEAKKTASKALGGDGKMKQYIVYDLEGTDMATIKMTAVINADLRQFLGKIVDETVDVVYFTQGMDKEEKRKCILEQEPAKGQRDMKAELTFIIQNI
jgi:hypothetical protein